jgi:hypothetical protein
VQDFGQRSPGGIDSGSTHPADRRAPAVTSHRQLGAHVLALLQHLADPSRGSTDEYVEAPQGPPVLARREYRQQRDVLVGGDLGIKSRILWHLEYPSSDKSMPKTPRNARQRILVMAQGNATRFPGKHFVPINGEPLLQRTLRLCRTLTSNEVVVVGWNTDPFVDLRTNLHTLPTPGNGLLDGIWGTRALWRDYTTLLLGDVVFSRTALQQCLEPKKFAFFGRTGPSTYTSSPWGEIFALSMGLKAQKLVTAAISDADIRQKREGRLWGLWDLLGSQAKWFSINDWTDDVDTPDELVSIQRLSDIIRRDDPGRRSEGSTA